MESIELGPTDILGDREEYTDRDGKLEITDLIVPGIDPGIYALIVSVGEGEEQVTVSTIFEAVSDPLLAEYDPNGDGVIERADMRRAVAGFFADPQTVTREEMRRLVGIYFQ